MSFSSPSDDQYPYLSGSPKRRAFSQPSAHSSSSTFLVLLPGSQPTSPSDHVLPTPPLTNAPDPLLSATPHKSDSLPRRRRVPFNLSFTPVSEPELSVSPSSNRCRLLGFTPLAEHDAQTSDHPTGSFRGPPEVRAKECAPCALFFTRADVFVSSEMAAQGLLAPSHTHYSPLRLQIGQSQVQPEPNVSELAFSEPEDCQTSATSSPALQFWDRVPTSATSTRASSPVSSLDMYCPSPAGLLTSMPMPMPISMRKKGIRRSRSLMGEPEPDDCWADDEWEDGRPESYSIGGLRRMSEPSSGKPKMFGEIEIC